MAEDDALCNPAHQVHALKQLLIIHDDGRLEVVLQIELTGDGIAGEAQSTFLGVQQDDLRTAGVAGGRQYLQTGAISVSPSSSSQRK